MKIAAILAAAVALVAGCGVSAATPAAHGPATPPASQRAPARVSARAAAKSAGAKRSTVAKMTAAQAAAMRRWYRGATVVQAGNVCGDVSRVFMDDAAVNSGSGSASLQGDITALQEGVATALANPPPVARDAAIWKRVLNAYSNAAGDPTSSGLMAAARSANNAAWNWTPSFGGTLLVCLNPDI